MQRSPAGASTPRESLLRTNSLITTVINRGPSVYVHMPDDAVSFGYLKVPKNRRIPFWVTEHRYLYSSIYQVYIAMPDGSGYASTIKPLNHNININDDIPEQYRCFVKIGSNNFLSAYLRPCNYQALHETTLPRVFVRMTHDNTVFVGELNHYYGRRPSWLQGNSWF